MNPDFRLALVIEFTDRDLLYILITFGLFLLNTNGIPLPQNLCCRNFGIYLIFMYRVNATQIGMFGE